MKTIIKEMMSGTDVRRNLSELRKIIKSDAEKQQFLSELKDEDLLYSLLGFLSAEDAKTRRNSALLLGDLELTGEAAPAVRDALFAAYRAEQTLFVRASYVCALSRYDVSDRLDWFKARRNELLHNSDVEENQKHYREELSALNALILSVEGFVPHKLCGKQVSNVVLTVAKMGRDSVVNGLRKDGVQAEIHPLGVRVKEGDLSVIFRQRSFRELLFEIPPGIPLCENPKEALEKSDGILTRLEELLQPNGEPFYFRVEIKGVQTMDERAHYARLVAEGLEAATGGRMVNSTSNYEVELRLLKLKAGGYLPFLKLSAVKDSRFRYRRETISSSMHPSLAAMLLGQAAPFLKENAQVMDPFCGVGTFLIERAKMVPVRAMYATDIFGEAIAKGRENARHANVNINFIQRDFFDFKHDYPFDEVIADMPVRGRRTKEEMDLFYEKFFSHLPQILSGNAKIFLYTNEEGFVRKQLRIHREFELLESSCVKKQAGFYFYIIGYTRN